MASDKLFFMKLALVKAEAAGKNQEVPVGAIVVKSNRVIGSGMNSVIKSMDPTAHAEILALRQAGLNLNNYRLTGSELFVSLEPCFMCYAAMVHARIQMLYYAAADEKTGIFSTGKFDLVKDIFNHKIEVESGVLADKASQMLKDFFKARRSAGAVERGGLENR